MRRFVLLALLLASCGEHATVPAAAGFGKKRFAGRGKPRFSRSVFPSYSRRKRPRRCNSGTTRSTNSSSPPGTHGNMMLNPSEAPP